MIKAVCELILLKKNNNISKERFYRFLSGESYLKCFQVVVAETDLFVYAKRELKQETHEQVMKYRGYVESFIRQCPTFATTLAPWTAIGPSPEIIRQMIHAGQKAGVGPMAAIAGAIAEMVGQELLQFSDEIIIENGGDLFIHKKDPFVVGIFAGESPFSNRIGIRVDSSDQPVSICTSSGTIGHSLSMGKAHAVTIRSKSAALADAAATATGNRVKTVNDISEAISFAQNISGVDGVLVLVDDKMGAWGDMEIVPVKPGVLK
ncbi:ApbE family lipoprotein [Candidatus Magnetomorum sp. HK-1]|nr:ApbE family lipoprotein [Candidatus Magnetomorum sp. HK-1]